MFGYSKAELSRAMQTATGLAGGIHGNHDGEKAEQTPEQEQHVRPLNACGLRHYMFKRRALSLLYCTTAKFPRQRLIIQTACGTPTTARSAEGRVALSRCGEGHGFAADLPNLQRLRSSHQVRLGLAHLQRPHA